MFCVWLIPSQPDLDAYQANIDSIIVKTGGSEYEPHATVFCGNYITAELEATKTKLRQIINDFQNPIDLTVTSVVTGNAFYKSLFVNFEDSAVLTNLFERIRSGIDPASGYTLSPHVSLMYGEFPTPDAVQQKENERAELALEWTSGAVGQYDLLRMMTDSSEMSQAAVASCSGKLDDFGKLLDTRAFNLCNVFRVCYAKCDNNSSTKTLKPMMEGTNPAAPTICFVSIL